MTHAQVWTRDIQIHLYSKVCSTHFVEGCFGEHCSTLCFSCSQPSQPYRIFSSCFPLMTSPGMILQLPLLLESQHPLGYPAGWLPSEENYYDLKVQNELLGFSFCFLSWITALFFFHPSTTLTPQRKKKLGNSPHTEFSEGSCTSPPHTLPSLEVNAMSVTGCTEHQGLTRSVGQWGKNMTCQKEEKLSFG